MESTDNVSRHRHSRTVSKIYKRSPAIPRKYNTHSWFNAGPPCATLAQHWSNNGSMYCVFRCLRMHVTCARVEGPTWWRLAVLWGRGYTRSWPNVVLMLGQRLRRWPNMKTTLGARIAVLCEWNRIDISQPGNNGGVYEGDGAQNAAHVPREPLIGNVSVAIDGRAR